MAQVLLLLVVALTVGAVVFGVMVLVSGSDPGLREVEPDGRGAPLPGSRPLAEQDVAKVTFDVGLRGYRMDQVDKALKRVAYDIGYKDELINVLAAEVEALRDGRGEDADLLRDARLAASGDGAAPPAAFAEESVSEAGAIDLGMVEAVRPAVDDEVPDGPFAPWPGDGEKTDEDERDHPTDAAETEAPQQVESGDDRVVTRG